MKLKFAKMHGLGNDFAVIDAINQAFSPRPDLVRRRADLFDGIGFDQMLIVEQPDSGDAAFKYRIFNADGGEVAQCGNGARCFARFVSERGLVQGDEFEVEVAGGRALVRFRLGLPRHEGDDHQEHDGQADDFIEITVQKGLHLRYSTGRTRVR